jgi:hypothetical protein
MQSLLPWRRKQGTPRGPEQRPDAIPAASKDLPVPSFPDGVKALHDCPDAVVDVCFIHGLTGDREDTWTVSGQPAPWPKTLLPSELMNARILTYGYDAYVVRKGVAASVRLIDHAMNLLNDLTADRTRCGASARPLIFVAHSLGGLVCKKAILLSRNNPEPHLRGIFEHAKGIIFMGTPHRGSWAAYWANMSASALGLVRSTNTSLLAVMERDDQLLESLQRDFWAMVREQREAGRPLEVACFFEELPMSILGRAVVIVSKDTATLEGYSSFSIHANHRDMVRFGSKEDNGFKRLVAEIVRWEAQIRDSAARQSWPVETHIGRPAGSSFYNYHGGQLNAPAGTVNISEGSGNQFPGATFAGPVHFG